MHRIKLNAPTIATPDICSADTFLNSFNKVTTEDMSYCSSSSLSITPRRTSRLDRLYSN